MECRQGKVAYANEGEARRAIRGQQRAGRTDCKLNVYKCRYADHFHVSHEVDTAAKTTRPKVAERTEAIPSAAKLRRILSDRAALIASQQKRLDAAEQAKAKADAAYRRAVEAAADELNAIRIMVDNIMAGSTR